MYYQIKVSHVYTVLLYFDTLLNRESSEVDLLPKNSWLHLSTFMQAEGKLHAQKFINRDDFLTLFYSKIKHFENKSI